MRVLSAAPLALGIATTSYLTAWRPNDTYEFLEHCHGLGAAGIQAAIHGDIPEDPGSRRSTRNVRRSHGSAT